MAGESDGLMRLVGGPLPAGPVAPGYYGEFPVPSGFRLIVCGPPNHINLITPSGKSAMMWYESADPLLYADLLEALGLKAGEQ